MGSLDPHPYVVTLEALCVEAKAVALVRPDGPVVVEEHVIGEPPRPDRPTPPQVRYAWGWEPQRVLRWLRGPAPAPDQIQIASSSNAASAREAQDAANGLLGHVHHVVPVPRLVLRRSGVDEVLEELPAGWLLGPAGERIAFLRAVSGVRWVAIHEGISLAPVAMTVVEELVRPAPPPPRPWWRFWG